MPELKSPRTKNSKNEESTYSSPKIEKLRRFAQIFTPPERSPHQKGRKVVLLSELAAKRSLEKA